MSDDRDPRANRSQDKASRDRELGMFAPITRRDLLHGAGVAALGALGAPLSGLAAAPEFSPEQAPDYYPPAQTGMRGSHVGSFEAAHERAWGREWHHPELLDEAYDLVVVGAGISGLAAAFFYRQTAGKDARILLLDNHDDFGGHCKRNEFRHAARTHVAVGGTGHLENPAGYSDVTHGLLRDLGVDLTRLAEAQDPNPIMGALGLDARIYCDADSFEADRLVGGNLMPLGRTGADGEIALVHHVDQIPISPGARRELRRFLTERTDYLSDVPDSEKPGALARMSYEEFLREHAGLSEEAARVFRGWPSVGFGVRAESAPALDCFYFGMPGLRGLGAFGEKQEAMLAAAGAAGADSIGDEGPLGLWFPDGCASLARLLVRALVPGAAPGRTQEDIVTARFDYARLDRPGAPARIRLSSTAVHVDALPDAGGVDVTYVRGGNPYRVRARGCVLACDHAMIPYLCPTLPKPQKEALRYGERVPMVSSPVLLREGRILERAGAGAFYSPGRLHSLAFALGRTVGRYQEGWDPAQPVVLYMLGSAVPMAAPIRGATAREQLREGRRRLYAMSFTDFEREIREHLAGMLGATGFEPARDILGITVNRWPHGYAYTPNPLFDPEWPEGQAPNEIARRRFGRIAIANTDAAYFADVGAGADEAHRAVRELGEAGLI